MKVYCVNVVKKTVYNEKGIRVFTVVEEVHQIEIDKETWFFLEDIDILWTRDGKVYFSDFPFNAYKERIDEYVSEGIISREDAKKILKDLERIFKLCKDYGYVEEVQ